MFTKTKRGQLQMGVTMMIAVVFIVLLLVSLILYFRFTFSEIEETQETILDQKYSGLLTTLISLPELRCSRSGVESECIDASKLDALKQIVVDNKNYYSQLFGDVKGIWVEVPSQTGSDDYYNSKLFTIYGLKDGMGVIYSVPVSLYYPDYKQYKIGILRIRGEL